MENDQPVFTFQLTEGWSELKLGAIIFKNSGLDTLLGGRIGLPIVQKNTAENPPILCFFAKLF